MTHSSSKAFPTQRVPPAPAIDYSTWPLGRLELAVHGPTCSQPTPTQSMFRSLTTGAAARNGFGIVQADLALDRLGMAAPTPCPFQPNGALVDAFGTALAMFEEKPVARTAYADYERCMARRGIDGASTPEAAEVLVLKRYDALIIAHEQRLPDGHHQGAPDSVVDKLSPSVEAFEVKDAVASVACQAKAIAPHAKALIREQNEVIDSAPPKIRKVLR